MNQTPPILTLKPSQVDPGWRAREVVGDEINQLASSIAREGQASPILVSKKGRRYELIAGNRRLTACKQLGTGVLAIVRGTADTEEAVRVQLAENCQREGFDALEAGEGLVKWKGEFEKKHPEVKHGGPRGNQHTGGKSQKSQLGRFTVEAARVFGCSESKIRELIAVGSLPKKAKAAAKKAGSRRARNKEVRELIKQVRMDRRHARLEKLAAEAVEGKPEPSGEGRVKLIHADNLKFFGSPAGGEGSFDICMTDPPYGQRKSLIAHLNRGDISTDFGSWDQLDVGWVVHLDQAMAPNAQLLICCPDVAIGEYKHALEALGWTWRGVINWHKTNPGTVSRPVYLQSMEYICWATRGTYHFEPFANCGAVEAHNYVEGPICGGNERLNHPTQKPEWLIEQLLNRHAHDLSNVLDPFAGVGTVAAVCKRLALQNTSIEMDSDYVGQAILRLKAA